jgi:hypothetical protein
MNPVSQGSDWRQTLERIRTNTQAIWVEMPDDVLKVQWGVIQSGAGSGEQALSVYIHLEAYCMLYGADVFYRLLKMAHGDSYDLKTVVYLTKEFVKETFNAFEFMGDLGFVTLSELGHSYLECLDELTTKPEYIELTSAMMTNTVRHHRWVHYFFPWNLGAAYPHRSVADIDKIYTILHAVSAATQVPPYERSPVLRGWQDVQRLIEEETKRIWTSEPEDITKINWGVISSGAGSGEQSISVIVHLEAYCMLVGADLFYRFLRISRNPDFTLNQVVDITREFVERTFNAFEFMGDLGLVKLKELGLEYLGALSELQNKTQYEQLSAAMMTCIVRHHRWIHYNLPWNMGGAYPHRKEDEIKAIYDVLFRKGLPAEPPQLPPPPNPAAPIRTNVFRRTIYTD